MIVGDPPELPPSYGVSWPLRHRGGRLIVLQLLPVDCEAVRAFSERVAANSYSKYGVTNSTTQGGNPTLYSACAAAIATTPPLGHDPDDVYYSVYATPGKVGFYLQRWTQLDLYVPDPPKGRPKLDADHAAQLNAARMATIPLTKALNGVYRRHDVVTRRP